MSAIKFLESMLTSGRVTPSGCIIMGPETRNHPTNTSSHHKRAMAELSKDDWARIAALYREGASMNEVSETINVQLTAVRAVLKASGVRIRHGSRATTVGLKRKAGK